MSIPSSTFAVVAFIVLFVPGFVFAVVRIWLRGFRADDKGIDTRIAQSLVVSVIFDAIYLIFAYVRLGPLVNVTDKTIEILDPVALGWTILIGAVLVPGLVAVLIYQPFRPRWRTPKERRPKRESKFPIKLVRLWNYSSVPTAWDQAAADPTNRFIRVLLPDKRYVGGYYGGGSYVSTYPEPRDLFISNPYIMSDSGDYVEPLLGSMGLWLSIPDGAIVDWVDPYFEPPLEQDTSNIPNQDDSNIGEHHG